MTSQAYLGQPPRFAVWFINLFTAHENAESICGDLLEEYSYLASKSGVTFARRWYWRQTMKTIAHLFGSGYRAAPWSTTAAAVGGFWLHRFVSGLPDKLLSAVTDRYLAFWSTHFNAYIWVLKGMMPVHLVASLFVGCLIALAAKRREMVVTGTLGLLLCAMAVASLLVASAQTGDAWFLWFLPLSFADSFGIVVGGAIVRTRRSAAITLAKQA
jgi:hypothetical protein